MAALPKGPASDLSNRGDDFPNFDSDEEDDSLDSEGSNVPSN